MPAKALQETVFRGWSQAGCFACVESMKDHKLVARGSVRGFAPLDAYVSYVGAGKRLRSFKAASCEIGIFPTLVGPVVTTLRIQLVKYLANN